MANVYTQSDATEREPPGYIQSVNYATTGELRLPCARCGTPVVMQARSGGVPMGCDRCTSGAERGVGYTIRQGSARMVLDHASVVQRICEAELAGTDFVRFEDGSWAPLAVHPSFRKYFFPGSTAITPQAPRRLTALSSGGGGYSRATVVAAIGLFAVAGAGWWTSQNSAFLSAAKSDLQAAPAPEVAPTPTVDTDTTMAGLAASIGPVEEPRMLLLAQSWTARFQGGAEGMTEAVRCAERAAVRNPDAETLGLLAMLYTEAATEPTLRVALLRRAKNLNPDHISVHRAEVAAAMVEGRIDDARASAARCLQLDPRDTWCAAHGIDFADRQTDEQRMLAYDALMATAQPSLGMLVRKATTAAVEAGADDAWPRVERALLMLPDNAELIGYRGVLALRSGDLKTAIATARKLADKAPSRLRLELAAHDIGAGNAQSAREWLAPMAAQEPEDHDDRFWLHLHGAQADYLEALKDPKAMQGAADSAESVLVSRPADATAAQVRMLTALAMNDLLSARRAFANADLHDLPGPDAAQILLTAVDLDLQGKATREAIPRLELAQRADPISPDVWLWTADVGLQAHDPSIAVDGLQAAVVHVDGTAGRRNPLIYSLPRPANPARITAMLHEQLDGVAGREDGLTLSLAVVDWLSGKPEVALTEVQGLVNEGTNPYALVLAARIRLQQGNAAAALPWAEAAAAQRPKESGFQLLRAQCLHALGRDAEARKALAYVSGSDLGAGYPLFLAQMSRDNKPEATRQAKAALELDPYNPDAVSLISLR